MILKGKEYSLIKDRKPGDLVYIGIETSNACNLNCIYCYTNAGKPHSNELSISDRKDIIDQAYELGAKVMFIAGAGEPFLDKHIFEQIEHAYKKNLTTILYTNGTLITKDIADFLYNHDVSPVIKLESLNDEIHDFLTNTKGSHQNAMNGIDNLLEAGYSKLNEDITRIGIASLYTKTNLKDLILLKDWCEERNILFSVDILSLSGRAELNKETIHVPFNEIKAIKIQLGEESGCVNGEGCVYWKYGMTIKIDGEVDFCTEGSSNDIGNIKNLNLKKIVFKKNALHPFIKGRFTCSIKSSYYSS